jgi:hypothetical protein
MLYRLLALNQLDFAHLCLLDAALLCCLKLNQAFLSILLLCWNLLPIFEFLIKVLPFWFADLPISLLRLFFHTQILPFFVLLDALEDILDLFSVLRVESQVLVPRLLRFLLELKLIAHDLDLNQITVWLWNVEKSRTYWIFPISPTWLLSLRLFFSSLICKTLMRFRATLIPSSA